MTTPSAIDATLASIKRQAEAQARQMPRRRAPKNRLDQAEQIRRFLAGEERHRLESGQITPSQWAEYQAAMLDTLAQAGALEV